MIRNYFKIAFRNFRRHKIFSLINIAGLAIGISAALVIYLIVHYEFSYDTFHKDRDRIYRVVTNMHFPDQDFKNAGVPFPLPEAMRSEVQGIEKSTYFWDAEPLDVRVFPGGKEEKLFRKKSEIVFAGENYFRFLHYDWLAGSADQALVGPGKVVLTESRAKTYFPYADITTAVGQTIQYNDSINATVTGIVRDLDKVTDFTFKEFVSFPTFVEELKRNVGWEWGSVSSASQFFVKLEEGVTPENINKQLTALREKHSRDTYLETDHFLQPLSDIHFNADYDAFDNRQAHKPTLYGLLAVAAFLLLLGCINFVNLTTAQATQRAKEIGIRKTMGSSKRHLVLQFLFETFLMTCLATVASILLAPAILKLFAAYIPEGLHFNLLQQPYLLGFIVVLVAAVTVLSGVYPALVLSGFRPVTVLKNQAWAGTSQSRRAWVRQTLTISQFVIAQFLIIATLVVGKQIRFSLAKDMGFRKDAIIHFRVPFNHHNPDNKQFVLQEKLKAIPGIRQLSLAGSPPANQGLSISTMKFVNDGKEIETSVEVKWADTAYFNLYNMRFVAGRQLRQSDTLQELVINENYARLLGYQDPTQILGKFIERDGGNIPIVGVLADIHTKSLHKPIQPLAYLCEKNESRTFHIALQREGNTDNWKSTIAAIGAAWKEIYPEENFKYEFFDESIAKFYKKEQDTAQLLNWSAGLAIFISCLGLLGLVIFTTTQRTKEIGVRKVLGASVLQIVSLLSKDFVRLVLAGFVIAAPLAWLAMNKWLEDFAYRTSISWWIFAACGAMMIFIALFTLSIQTIRSAIANPAKSLRTE